MLPQTYATLPAADTGPRSHVLDIVEEDVHELWLGFQHMAGLPTLRRNWMLLGLLLYGGM